MFDKMLGQYPTKSKFCKCGTREVFQATDRKLFRGRAIAGAE